MTHLVDILGIATAVSFLADVTPLGAGDGYYSSMSRPESIKKKNRLRLTSASCENAQKAKDARRGVAAYGFACGIRIAARSHRRRASPLFQES